MAFPVGAAIAAGASLVGTGANAYSQGKTNQKTRQHNMDMFHMQNMWNNINWQAQNQYNEGLWNKQNQYNERLWYKMNQRADEVWHRENSYNSPMQQMARFKEAGLNPNLIYGQQNTGGSISTANFQSDRQHTAQLDGARPQPWNPKAPNFDLVNGVQAFTAFRESAARTNNLEEQNKLIAAQALDTMASVKKKGVETQNMERLIDYQIDALQESTRKTIVETQLGINRDHREAALNKSHLLEAIERMRQSQLTQRNIQADTMLKMLELKLKANEITPRNALLWLQENLGNLIEPTLNEGWGYDRENKRFYQKK